MTSRPVSVGELLLRYLNANGSEDSDELLATLVIDYAQPVIRRVVGARLDQNRLEEREDLAADASAALIGRLIAMRSKPGLTTRIADFEAYAAGVAVNTIHAHFASKFPARTRLRRRIRFALTSDQRLEITETAEGLWLCGVAGNTANTPAHGSDLEACRTELSARVLPGQLSAFLVMLFACLGKPAELNELTSLAAELLGVSDRSGNTAELENTLSDPGPGPAAQAETRAWLAALWQEIRALPCSQRAALLLNLRTPQGAAIGLIGDLGVAPFSELSQIAGMASQELHQIWNRLPLDDLEIASRLGIDRQQVINLRSTARRRLERKMK